ncbi:phosphopantetheine-binding protein [Streptomyces sp. NPDC051576]|uniref:phosphopantetheine-binding protein n=1 Tax=Streptomyces sp. NPDC051576 TaxID=3155803 RepID=UPI0034145A1C
MIDDHERSTSDDPAPATGEELKASLGLLIGADPAEIADDANLIRLGLGSLQLMRLVTQWRRAGLTLTFGDMAANPTFAAWNERITKEVAARADDSA